MNDLRFETLAERQLCDCAKLLTHKGHEYSPVKDRLGMFKTAASLQGITPKQALLGMAAKHFVSIANMCAEDGTYPLTQWLEKITDSMNYLILLRALVEEEQEELNETHRD